MAVRITAKQYIVAHFLNLKSQLYPAIFWLIIILVLLAYQISRLPRLGKRNPAPWPIFSKVESWSMQRRSSYGTNLDITGVSVLGIIALILSVAGPDSIAGPYIYSTVWSKAARFGDMAFAVWPLIIFCAMETTSSSRVTRWLGLRIEWITRMAWHRLLAFVVYILTTIHVILWTVQFARAKINGRPAWYTVWAYPNLRLAAAAYAAFTLLMFGASDRFRRQHYEASPSPAVIFYASHILLVLMTLVFSIAHHPQIGQWLGIPLALWGIERLARYTRRVWIQRSSNNRDNWVRKDGSTNGSRTTLVPPSKQPWYKAFGWSVRRGLRRVLRLKPSELDAGMMSPVDKKVAEIEKAPTTKVRARARLMPSEVMQLRVMVPGNFKWSAGQNITLRVPQLSRWQAHPFTIANYYDPVYEGEAQELLLVIKARQGFTRRLLQLLQAERRRTLTTHSDLPLDGYVVTSTGSSSHDGLPREAANLSLDAFVDGPFGAAANLDMNDFSTVVCVVGGVGITLGSAVFEQVCAQVAQANKTRRSGSKIIRLRFVWLVRSYADIAWMGSRLIRAHSIVTDDSVQVEIFVTKPTTPSKDSEPLDGSRNFNMDEMIDEYEDEERQVLESNLALKELEADNRGLTQFDGDDYEEAAAEARLSSVILQEGMLRRARSRAIKRRAAEDLAQRVPPPRQALSADGAWGANIGEAEGHRPPASSRSSSSTVVDHTASADQSVKPLGSTRPSALLNVTRTPPNRRHTSDQVVPLVSGNETVWIHDEDYQAMLTLSEVARVGRPPLGKILQEELIAAQGDMVVYSCGPPGLDRSIREEVGKVKTSSLRAESGKNIKIELYAETLE